MVLNASSFRLAFGLDATGGMIGGIQPISAGILGVPVGFLAIWLGSWVWPQRPTPADPPVLAPENPFPGL